MFKCKCGGIFIVIAIEELPENLSKEEKVIYNRVCDVECQKCGKRLYSQPYDGGSRLNELRQTKNI